MGEYRGEVALRDAFLSIFHKKVRYLVKNWFDAVVFLEMFWERLFGEREFVAGFFDADCGCYFRLLGD